MPLLYPTTPLSFYPLGTTTSAGYTTRVSLVGTASYTGQRVYQTYLSTVMMLSVNGQWASDLSDMTTRDEFKVSPYQLYKVYITTMTSPDGDLPFKHGDYFYPNGNMVGLVSGTSYPIRGVMPNANYIELYLERKL